MKSPSIDVNPISALRPCCIGEPSLIHFETKLFNQLAVLLHRWWIEESMAGHVAAILEGDAFEAPIGAVECGNRFGFDLDTLLDEQRPRFVICRGSGSGR